MICTCQENRVKYYPCLNGSLHVSGGLGIHWKLWVRTCSLRVVDTNIPCGLLKWSRPKAMVKPEAILVHWETTVSHSRNLIPRDGIRKGSWGQRNNHKTALWSNVCPFTKSSTALLILLNCSLASLLTQRYKKYDLVELCGRHREKTSIEMGGVAHQFILNGTHRNIINCHLELELEVG